MRSGATSIEQCDRCDQIESDDEWIINQALGSSTTVQVFVLLSGENGGKINKITYLIQRARYSTTRELTECPSLSFVVQYTQ